MNLDRSLFTAFKPIKHADEIIYWAGRPDFLCFIGPGVLLLIFALMWLPLPYRLFFQESRSSWSITSVALGLMFLLIAVPGVLNLVKLLIRYKKTVYAITDRRILIREGSLSVEYASIDFGRITEVRVSQHPFEAAMGLGTLWIYVGGSLKNGTNHEALRAIHDPHEVCRKLTEISVSPIAIV